MKRTLTPTENANLRKARSIRAKYLRERDALDAKFKADAEALGFVLVADVIQKTIGDCEKLKSLKQVRNLPALKDKLDQVRLEAVREIKAKAI